MNVLIKDSNGKTLYNKVFSSWSSDTIKVTGSAYSHTGLMELFEEAVNNACNDFLNQLGR
jgi:hypothetical protein